MNVIRLGNEPDLFDNEAYRKSVASYKRSEARKKAKASRKTGVTPKLYGNYKKLQDIYEAGKLYDKVFYDQAIAYVKSLLNKFLWQNQFGEDNINDCFIDIYEKVTKNYDPLKGNLGTFIRAVVRNYTTKVNYKLQNHPDPISLNFEYIDREELQRSSYSSPDESSDEEDEDLGNVEEYCTSLKCENELDEVEYYCDLLNVYSNMKELSNKDFNNIHKIEAVKRDLLWNIWKQSSQLL